MTDPEAPPVFPQVETIRRAAALMRRRAEAAAAGPWRAEAEMVKTGQGDALRFVGEAYGLADKWPNAEHIASWHPAVALAVAAWLDIGANPYACVHLEPMLAVARAYLGEEEA